MAKYYSIVEIFYILFTDSSFEVMLLKNVTEIENCLDSCSSNLIADPRPPPTEDQVLLSLFVGSAHGMQKFLD